MRGYIAGLQSFGKAALKVLVIFALVRLAFGVFAIAFLADEGFAYSLRATAIVALAVAVGLAVALFVRSMGPIHEAD